MRAGTAVTYRTGTLAADLRTVIVADAKTSVVLLPNRRMTILSGRHLHGPAYGCRFWAEALGLDVSDDQFLVPVEQVVQTRPIGNLKINKRKH